MHIVTFRIIKGLWIILCSPGRPMYSYIGLSVLYVFIYADLMK